jgi:hypothetical protein
MLVGDNHVSYVESLVIHCMRGPWSTIDGEEKGPAPRYLSDATDHLNAMIAPAEKAAATFLNRHGTDPASEYHRAQAVCDRVRMIVADIEDVWCCAALGYDELAGAFRKRELQYQRRR